MKRPVSLPLLMGDRHAVCPAPARKRRGGRPRIRTQRTIAIAGEPRDGAGGLIRGEQHLLVRMHHGLIGLSSRLDAAAMSAKAPPLSLCVRRTPTRG